MGGNMMSGNMMSGNMGMMNNMNSMMGGQQMFGGGFPNMAGMMGGNGQMNPMAMMQMQQMAAQNAAMSNQMNQMNIPGADLPGSYPSASQRGDGAIPNDLSSNNHQNIMNSGFQQDMAGMLQQLEERNKRVDNALKIVGRMNPEAAEQAQQVANGNSESQQPNNNVPPATECKQ